VKDSVFYSSPKNCTTSAVLPIMLLRPCNPKLYNERSAPSSSNQMLGFIGASVLLLKEEILRTTSRSNFLCPWAISPDGKLGSSGSSILVILILTITPLYTPPKFSCLQAFAFHRALLTRNADHLNSFLYTYLSCKYTNFFVFEKRLRSKYVLLYGVFPRLPW